MRGIVLWRRKLAARFGAVRRNSRRNATVRTAKNRYRARIFVRIPARAARDEPDGELKKMATARTIEIVAIAERDKLPLWELMQRYLAELSTLGGDGPVQGAYRYRYFDAFWREAERWPMWIVSDGETAGFALVRKDGARMEMAEFFIEPAFRRGGIGVRAARAIIQRFPGRWELSEFRENLPAIAFWRRVLDGFAKYHETSEGERITQLFEAPGSA